MYRFITFFRDRILLFIKQCPSKFMFGRKWWSKKVGAKLLSDLVVFSIFYSDMPIDFQESIWAVLLFDVTLFGLLSKSVFFTKLAISFLLAKFACFSLEVKFYDVNLLNFWVLIYLWRLWSEIILLLISLTFVLLSVFWQNY